MAENTEVSLHFSDYWRVIKNRWPIIATVFILVVATAYFYTRSLPKIYSASAVLKVNTNNNPDLAFYRPDFDTFDPVRFQTEFEIIQSKKVLEPVIESLNLRQVLAERVGSPQPLTMEQAYILLKKGYLQIQPYRNTKLIEISVFDTSPAQAKLIANTLAERYKEHRIDEITGRSTKGLKVVEEELAKQKQKLDEASDRVEMVRQKWKITQVTANGVGSRDSTTTLKELELQRKEAMLTEFKADLLARKVRLEKVKQLTTEELENSLTTLGIPTDVITSLKQSWLAAQSNVKTLEKQGYGLDHPKMQSAMALESKTREQLDKQIKGIVTGLEIDYTAAESKVKSIEADVNALKESLLVETTEGIREFEEAKRERATQESLHEILQAKLAQTKVDENIDVQPVEIVSEAESPDIGAPVKPNLKLNVALSAVVGLVLGISLAFFIEYLDTSVKSLDDVERFLDTTVAGVIPEGVNTLNLEGPDSPNAEAYRILRAKIDLKAREDGATTVTVVSGGPGEGKTTTLFNLAYVCAYSGISTLIIDTDFRRHSINTVLGIDNSQGLADYLLGYGPLHEYIRSTDIPNLQVITAGKLPPQCMGALSPAKMSEIIETLKPHYEVIMFDSPPILGISDAAVIVHEVDMTLLAIQHRRYPRNISWRAKKVVEEVQGRLVGVVLNKVQLKSDESYYYYTSYYGYHGYYKGGSRKEAQQRAKVNKRKINKENKKQALRHDKDSTPGDRY